MAVGLSSLLSGVFTAGGFSPKKGLASHLFSDSAFGAFILDWAIHYVASSAP